MNKRIFLFLFLLFIISSLLFGCGTEDMQMNLSLESINESNVDILNSSKYKNHIEEHLKQLDPEINISKVNYAFGDLDGDSIPELALYIERDPEDLGDQGALVVYKLINNEYKMLDKVPMNYDNANNILKLGMLSKEQAGILINNQVGIKAAVTYGYILEDGKLKSILNPKKVNLISLDSMESIEDIDGDGILEFGIFTVDPETEETKVEDAKKIILWYKWDGFDGAIFVKKDIIKAKSTRKSRASGAMDSLIPGSEHFLEGLQKNMDASSKSYLSALLSCHIKNLEVNSSYNSLDIAALFSKYIKNSSLLDFLETYNLTNNRINDIDYIKRNKVLEAEADLKSMLTKNLNKGYYLSLKEGRYIYTPYYSKFASDFSKSLTKELQGYLGIMTKSTDLPHVNQDTLLIDKIDLAKRLQEIENYRIAYSYSEHIDSINNLYRDYLSALLFYSTEGGILMDSKIVSDKELDMFIDIVNSYPEAYFSQLVNELLVLLNNNQNSLSPEIRKQITQSIR